MKIERQHETTKIDELVGADCTRLLGVGDSSEGVFYAWYLQANDTWYRFYIQCGILFWDTSAPDPEDDLADDEDYYDALQSLLQLGDLAILAAKMESDVLTIDLTAGKSLVFNENEETGGMSICVG